MAIVAVVGAGLIGQAWALAFGRAGHEVRLYDEDASAVKSAGQFAAAALASLAEQDLLDGQSPAVIAGRLRSTGSLADALAGASHVQESTPEDLDTKTRVFAQLDELAAPDAVLASSTSALLPSRFTERLAGRGRCLVVHPLNPPYLIPAVEIVPAPWTDPTVVERTRALMSDMGQSPIVMKREIDGFVMNRLQGALLEEAFRLVADGYASAEDIDVGLREGLALRWSFMGPFETIDLNAPGGVRDYVLRYQSIYERLFPSMQRRVDWAGAVLEAIERDRRAKLPEESLADRRMWRDRRLMALASHKRKASRDIGS